MKDFENKNLWALVLGGSSGLGLSTAKKLAKHGLNICVVHRSPRMLEEQINGEFEEIKNEGVQFLAFNKDAGHAEKRSHVIDQLKDQFGSNHKIKTMVHSIAKGNLKPMVSKETNVLKQDDFALTIAAMGTSLYDWTKAIFEADFKAAENELIENNY